MEMRLCIKGLFLSEKMRESGFSVRIGYFTCTIAREIKGFTYAKISNTIITTFQFMLLYHLNVLKKSFISSKRLKILKISTSNRREKHLNLIDCLKKKNE